MTAIPGPGGAPATLTVQLLRLIFEHQPVSQSNLRDMTGLSVSTISQATRRLLTQGVVRELGLRKEPMGRPRVLLGIDPGYANVIGVQLNAERNLIVMTDLRGQIVGEQPMPSGPIPPRRIGDALAGFLRGAPGGRRVAAVGLALAGLVDAEVGTCIASTVLDWTDVPIARLLSRRVGLPVHVENDANALSHAAMLFGQLAGAQSAAVVTLGDGVGSSIIIERRIHRGRNGGAGEIGQVRLDDPASPPGTTLEGAASARAILNAIHRATGTRPTALAVLDDDAGPEVRGIIVRAGRHLGAALARLATTLDPDVILVAMEPHAASRILIEAMTRSFEDGRFELSRRPTPLRMLPDSDRMWALGAAGVAIGKVVESLAVQPLHETA